MAKASSFSGPPLQQVRPTTKEGTSVVWAISSPVGWSGRR